jgi:hypothetical protein
VSSAADAFVVLLREQFDLIPLEKEDDRSCDWHEGLAARRVLPTHLGCDGRRRERVGAVSRCRSGAVGVLRSGRRVLDRPADPSRPVLVKVATYYLATIWPLILL